MTIALLLARLALAAVFGTAGAAKVSGRASTRAAAAAFGVPARLTGPVTLALPAAELLIAAALIPAPSAAPAGWAALALLALFSVTVAISLARGRHPDCYCFGQFTAAPIGWRTLARNVALAVVAGFVALGGWWAGQPAGWWAGQPAGWWAGQPAGWWAGQPAGWWAGQLAGLPGGGTGLGDLGTSRMATVAAVTALGLALIVDIAVVVLLLGRPGAGPRRRDHAAAAGTPGPTPAAAPAAARAMLPVGTAAPEFEVAGPEGNPMTLTGLRSAGHPVLLIFTDPDCGSCRTLLPDVAVWQARHPERFTAALISRRPAAAGTGAPAHHGLAHVGVQRDREVALAMPTPVPRRRWWSPRTAGSPAGWLPGRTGSARWSPRCWPGGRPPGPDGLRPVLARGGDPRNPPIACGPVPPSPGRARWPGPPQARTPSGPSRPDLLDRGLPNRMMPKTEVRTRGTGADNPA